MQPLTANLFECLLINVVLIQDANVVEQNQVT